jgi:hypothetical protein
VKHRLNSPWRPKPWSVKSSFSMGVRRRNTQPPRARRGAGDGVSPICHAGGSIFGLWQKVVARRERV